MTFFSYSSAGAQGFSVSRWFWLYFAISIPLTLIVFFAWQLWLRRASREHKNMLGDIELGPVESGSLRDKKTGRNIFWGLKYSDPTSRPADVETVAEGVDGEMEEENPGTIWR
jgi:hypothetical protein